MKLTKKFPVKNVVLGLLGVVVLDMMLRTFSSANQPVTPPIFYGGKDRSMQQSRNVIDLEPVREGDSIVYQDTSAFSKWVSSGQRSLADR